MYFKTALYITDKHTILLCIFKKATGNVRVLGLGVLTNAVSGSVKLISWTTSACDVVRAEMITSQYIANVFYAVNAIMRFFTNEIRYIYVIFQRLCSLGFYGALEICILLLLLLYHIVTFAMAPINQSSSAPPITNTIVVDNIVWRL